MLSQVQQMNTYRTTGPKYMSSYSKDSLVILEYLDQRTNKFMSPEIASHVLKDLSNHSLENSFLKYSKQRTPQLKAPQSSPITFKSLGQKTLP